MIWYYSDFCMRCVILLYEVYEENLYLCFLVVYCIELFSVYIILIFKGFMFYFLNLRKWLLDDIFYVIIWKFNNCFWVFLNVGIMNVLVGIEFWKKE